MKKNLFNLIFLCFSISFCTAQVLHSKNTFTKQDTLRGSNTEFRNWWNVLKYNITVEPNYKEKSIEGEVIITFNINEKFSSNKSMQIDLQQPLNIKELKICKVEGINKHINLNSCDKPIKLRELKRNKNLYFLNTKTFKYLKPNQTYSLIIKYSGKPTIAKNAPWDGGWVFSKDQNGNPWMSVACQGLGASVWYPCKDYQGDEPDLGAILNIIVPKDLVGVANGRLINEKKLPNNKKKYSWEVKNPINNYNIIPNIGKYVNFTDTFEGENGALDLSYWVLDYNLDKAKKQFTQVKPMLASFEKWFGPYPFYEDSFKLIETPYLGMEHQSGIAYGNNYKNGYLGNDLSRTGVGLKWDFIIIHEAGHEWFGNNITTKDIADMWVHEGFTAYSETLFTEDFVGKKEANRYIQGTKNNIQNNIPIIGEYGVNQEGSGDMYYKAANMIHTLRQLMEDDIKFKQMLRNMNATYYHKTVTTQEIEKFLSDYTGIDLTAFFNQYLRTINIPTLEFNLLDNKLNFRYTHIVKDFDMPVKLSSEKWIYPTSNWKSIPWKSNKVPTIDANFLVKTKF